jgi:signal peptidase I
MRFINSGLATTAALVAIAGPGCGTSSTSSSDEIRESIDAYRQATEKRDGDAACEQLSRSLQLQVLRAAGPRGGGQAMCARVLTRALRARTDTAAPPPFEVVSVHVTDNRATAATQRRTGNVTVKSRLDLVRENDQWRLNAFGAPRSPDGRRVLTVPSEAMQPTLKVRSSVLLDDKAYTSRRPAIGDIVAFHPPKGADTNECGSARVSLGRLCARGTPAASPVTFLKRIVAGPGDRVAIRDGHTIRNGHRAAEPFVAECADGTGCDFTDAITVPSDQYYVLGDNRGESADSRFWGAVPAAWIIGKVEVAP